MGWKSYNFSCIIHFCGGSSSRTAHWRWALEPRREQRCSTIPCSQQDRAGGQGTGEGQGNSLMVPPVPPGALKEASSTSQITRNNVHILKNDCPNDVQHGASMKTPILGNTNGCIGKNLPELKSGVAPFWASWPAPVPWGWAMGFTLGTEGCGKPGVTLATPLNPCLSCFRGSDSSHPSF